MAAALLDSSIRCLIVKCGVSPLKVVGVDILSNGGSGFPDVVVLCQISFLILEAAEPALNHDVVSPATFPIHTLAYTIFFYKVNVLLACKLASLIGIQYLRFCHLECFFLSVNDHSCIKRIIHFPANDAPAVPINNGCQI